MHKPFCLCILCSWCTLCGIVIIISGISYSGVNIVDIARATVREIMKFKGHTCFDSYNETVLSSDVV